MVLGPGSALEDMLAEKLDRHRDHDDQNKLSSKVLVMQPILRFLQLLCENHNQNLQVSPKRTLVFFLHSNYDYLKYAVVNIDDSQKYALLRQS